MTSRPLVILGVIIILIAVLAAAGYMLNGSAQFGAGAPATTTAPTGGTDADASTSPDFYEGTSTPGSSLPPVGIAFASSTFSIPSPASSTLDMSSWHLYVDPQHRYSVEHPANLVEGSTGGALLLAFPKNSHFHWPLLDDAKVTVTVAKTCPSLIAARPEGEPAVFMVGDRSYTRLVATDAGAGNRYLEVAYDTQENGICYHIDFLDHGTNGAGFYVDDASLVRSYDAQHDKDLSVVLGILASMVKSFRILAPTP